MKQEQFVARYQQEWQDLEHWLLLRAGASRRTRRKASALALDDTAFPQRYRRLCQQLALARERGSASALSITEHAWHSLRSSRAGAPRLHS